MTSARPAGRPRRSSRATLEEAAAELFLENTYAATTVEQIAQRAGVSRATFFNYFGSKADLLWAGLDDTLRACGEALASVDPAVPVVDGVVDALIGAARSRGEGWLPLALTQHEVMGLGADVAGEGVARAAPLVDPVAQALARGTGRRASSGQVRVAASIVAAATAAAVVAWASDGVGRGPLEDVVRRALDPLRTALAASLA
ncbi:TetR/AcrR family transcriptional regulator [Clavibacter nebraskensis]|uniref:Transcriptional regulator, TetR family n=2 Tax=Clavibacter nebraskensis TaxID=31963 RepID=A0AAI8ZI79_9MICO|nr:helix-turn-helix domain-containing protein [Clavibacter nebraskensis]QGV66628.1 TetR family transcriptional regulator [Clavibacter nebraskensis]UQB09121.1 TetR/AcrR family transcriptional regulator [Clavibacter nebraskensis]CCE75405.1 transcriptional regulator, TetR family [Clavibacter nebraskensis NCPPB 2581]